MRASFARWRTLLISAPCSTLFCLILFALAVFTFPLARFFVWFRQAAVQNVWPSLLAQNQTSHAGHRLFLSIFPRCDISRRDLPMPVDEVKENV